MTKEYLEEEEGLTPRLVMEEATRCLLCLDAPCSKNCPAGTDPAKFIRSVRFKNVEGAVTTVRENNILAGVCARVCPVEKYCEKACSRTGIDKPIQISKIQRYLTDYEACTHMQVLEPKKLNGKKVAVVGSGPAGLTAAGNLAMQGYEVTVYEKYPHAGGYLRYGIPQYRLPNSVVDQEVAIIEKLGVKFVFNTRVGIDVLLENLKKEYDAVVLAVGYSQGKMLDMFKDNKHVELAVDFLARVKEKKGKIKLPKNAVVVGGGDVAMDCATTLKKLGVENVTDVAYEQFSEFKASEAELELTRKSGVTILDGYIPVQASKSGTLTFKHRVINSQLKIKSGLTILAVGQIADLEGLNVTAEDLNKNYQIGKSNLFFAGDIAQGDKTVVYAVKTGKEVCKEVMNYLGGNK
jgi:dihydropyrimidine dehydrogenase (NAD+) subunit PreT